MMLIFEVILIDESISEFSPTTMDVYQGRTTLEYTIRNGEVIDSVVVLKKMIMENKINLIELLKDCPQGMELSCPMYENLYFDEVDEAYNLPISCYTTYHDNTTTVFFTEFGSYNRDKTAKCIIFPKGKTTWEGFHKPFEPGDIVITDNNEHAFIYSGENDDFWEAYCGVYCGTRDLCINSKQWSDKCNELRLATEKEKEKLFQVIKDNGYKWNADEKKLEKLIEPKFKVGDKVRYKDDKTVITITGIKDDYYFIQYYNIRRSDYQNEKVSFADQDNYELVSNKFDITTLKPFDKVLVRDNDKERWDITFYELYDKTNKSYPYRTLGGTIYKQCIPYKDNEHLAGFVKECSDYYKTWVNE